MPDDVTGISTLAEAQQTLMSQPFSVLIGAQLVVYTRGRAELEIPLRPDLLQQFGFAHGGVLAYAADNALTFAAGTVLGPSIVTTGMTLDYLRPAKGPLLRAVATVVNGGRTQALCRCEIYSVDDDSGQKLCAAAQGGARVIDLTR
ncbi:PaaI family thioesterase [Rhodococcus sp. NPDC058639]|uniref:PaaI family thioesterase n=1 Tax=unclassified Rhodococcus (in: high G+C Gram-positive bacteria) TaxID=192944 RepID=UPI003655E815